MAVLEIRTFDDPVLRRRARAVSRVNRTVRQTLDDLCETMRVCSGVGLAAPQIGVSRRLAVVDVGEGPHFLVNPEIISCSQETEVKWEGCLSWPGYVGEVERPVRVTVKALDRDGHDIWVEGEGYLARALCHEIDHLDGIVFVDRARTIAEIPEEETAEVASGEEAKKATAVFMGSPEFALPSLDEILLSGLKVSLVVTQPDRPYGRKQEMKPTPVRERAEKLGIPVIACPDVSEQEVVRAIKEKNPDYIAVAAFGQKLPREVLDAPKNVCLNVHPSLLPRHRGPNPVQRAIMEGDSVTGVSVTHMTERMDAGDIVVQKAVDIGEDETYGTLEARLAVLGAHALVEAITLIEAGSAARMAQDESEATVARRLTAGEDVIDWSWPAARIHNLVRGLSPRPGAVTGYGQERIKVWETELTSREGLPDAAPGSVLGLDGDAAVVRAGDGAIKLVELQPDGRRPMSARAFLAGRQRNGFVFAHKEG